MTSALALIALSAVLVAAPHVPGHARIVRPGAPGQASQAISPQEAERQGEAAVDPVDVAFMQHMIVHHAQAVDMVALAQSHTANPRLRLIANRIGLSQSREIDFMRRWLAERGEPTAMPRMASSAPPIRTVAMSQTQATETMAPSTIPLMKGMLSPAQMAALERARGALFDRLFLTGMIAHHQGAIDMVTKLMATPGAGEDAEVGRFAGDVIADQRTEIALMTNLLEGSPSIKRSQ